MMPLSRSSLGLATALVSVGLAVPSNAQVCDGYDHGATTFGTDPAISTFILLIVMGALVMFMQAGFAMLEAGSLGVTAVVSVLFKNLGDCLIGAFIWWAVGWAWAYGEVYGDNDENAPITSTQWFIGSSGYFAQNLNPCNYPMWFYQWTFAATTATIVSGAVAGRTQLTAYLAYTVWIVGFVYPTIVHWTWSGTAWLAQGSINDQNAGVGYFDYAGSGIVHCTGGTAALIGAWMVGPRGTSDMLRDGLKPFENVKDKSEISGHSMPLVALGTLILVFGFIGFNGGSVLALETVEEGVTMSLAVMNTILAASGGGLAAVFCTWLQHRKYWSLMQMCNGTIAGMVAICAGANTVYPWAAWVIGFIGGLSYKAWSVALTKAGIDDPIDAAAVHLGAGAWGVIAVTLFAMDKEAPLNAYGMGGIFYDAYDRAPWVRLGWAFLGLLVIIGWTTVNMLIVFSILKYFKCLRVDDAVIAGDGGLDKHEHGEYAYVLDPHTEEAGTFRDENGNSTAPGVVTNGTNGTDPAAKTQVTPV
eukprot:m.145639 g.145639  ORF g.145639 m.145639 type:complete len:530 (-) comp11629_c1_seq9:298-1887(-)